jgi:hypothetical protein
MKPTMTQISLLGMILLTAMTAASTIPWKQHAQDRAAPEQAAPAGTSTAGDVARGKYLVDEVARCWECHTPVLPDGGWDRARWLQGGAIFIRPVVPDANWAERAPGIAGLASYSEQQIQQVLEKGVRADGVTALQPPMHTYHLSHADALAISAYLRTLQANPR